MKLPSEAFLLRIFIGESDKMSGRPLYEVIVEEARKRGMAGATVTRGFLGFGANSRVHTSKILRLSEDLPIVVEIVDMEERIEAFLPELDEMIKEGMVTLEKVRVIAYRHNAEGI
jgi:PII-like signaling protein